jgi:hypothetical protein
MAQRRRFMLQYFCIPHFAAASVSTDHMSVVDIINTSLLGHNTTLGSLLPCYCTGCINYPTGQGASRTPERVARPSVPLRAVINTLKASPCPEYKLCLACESQCFGTWRAEIWGKPTSLTDAFLTNTSVRLLFDDSVPTAEATWLGMTCKEVI